MGKVGWVRRMIGMGEWVGGLLGWVGGLLG